MPLPGNATISYITLAANYTWNEEMSLEQHQQELKNFFKADPNVTQDVVRSVLHVGISHPDRFLRSPAEQNQARRINEKMQDHYVTIIPRRAQVLKKYKTDPDPLIRAGSARLNRGDDFLHLEDTAEADAFNRTLLTAFAKFDEDPDTLRRLLLDELDNMRKALNLNTQEDINRLYDLTDEQLADRYPDLSRYLRAYVNAANGACSGFFTEEQLAELNQHDELMGLLMRFDERCNLIANPHYVELDPYRLYEEKVEPDDILTGVERRVPNLPKDTAYTHHLYNFFERLQSFYQTPHSAVIDRVAALNPALTGIFEEERAKDALVASLTSGKPAIVFGTDGQQYVITNQPKIDKVPTAQEYSANLLARATKADRFLLTGSRQFANMMKAEKALNEAKAQNKSTEELIDKAVKLEEAAKAYLEYKEVNLEKYTGHASLVGKNLREQSRLNVAADILAYAKAQGDVYVKVYTQEEAAAKKEREEAAKNAPKPEAAPPAPQGGVQNANNEPKPEKKEAGVKEFTQNRTRLSYAQGFAASARTYLPRTVPIEEREVESKTLQGDVIKVKKRLNLMEQDDFTALCALACGSKEAGYSIERSRKDNNGKTIKKADGTSERYAEHVVNENPEQTLKAALDAIQKERPTKDIPDPLKLMMRGAQSVAFHAVRDRDYDKVARLLADGVKLNNKLMQEAKGFTPEFCACAQLNAKAMSILANPQYPELSAAANKYLTAEDKQIANAGKALNDMHIACLMTQNSLFARCGIKDNGQSMSSEEFKQDLAKVCHMYGTEWQMAGGKLNLATLNYQEYANQSERIAQGLAGDRKFNDFLDTLKTKSEAERYATVGSPKTMRNLFDSITLSAQQSMQQQQQNQPQLQLNVVQNAPEPKVPNPPGFG